MYTLAIQIACELDCSVLNITINAVMILWITYVYVHMYICIHILSKVYLFASLPQHSAAQYPKYLDGEVASISLVRLQIQL